MPFCRFKFACLFCSVFSVRSRALQNYNREDSSCYARKWNWIVPRCWIFIYSSTKSRRRICWFLSWNDWKEDFHAH
ncbi:hypothetical protein Q3G72_010985 [Acer saccharum]|nr:hypothetical protein Q3G72_010985 [Acer saccharum]